MAVRHRLMNLFNRSWLHAVGRLTVPLLQLITLTTVVQALGVEAVSRYSLHLAAVAVLFSIFELSLPNVYLADASRPSAKGALLARLGTLLAPTVVAALWVIGNRDSMALVAGLAVYRVSISLLSLAQAIALQRRQVAKSTLGYLGHGLLCAITVIVAGTISTTPEGIVLSLSAASLCFSLPIAGRILLEKHVPSFHETSAFLRKGTVVGIAAAASSITLQIPIFYAGAANDDLLVARMAVVVQGFSIFLALSTSLQQLIIYNLSQQSHRTSTATSSRVQIPIFLVSAVVAMVLLWVALPIVTGLTMPLTSSAPAVVACALLPLIALISSKNLVDQLFGHQLIVVTVALLAAGGTALILLTVESKSILQGTTILLAGTAVRYVSSSALDRLRGRQSSKTSI